MKTTSNGFQIAMFYNNKQEKVIWTIDQNTHDRYWKTNANQTRQSTVINEKPSVDLL